MTGADRRGGRRRGAPRGDGAKGAFRVAKAKKAAVLMAGLAMATLGAGVAHADDKADFERCDGRQHPGKQPDGLRGPVGSTPFRMVGDDHDAQTIAACTNALASPRLLPTQTLRRVHLLRARAAARLHADDPAGAVADLDAADASAGALAQDRFYQRSMGVSLTLLRALAAARTGDVAAAAPLARKAIAARPYALQVQQVAATILQFDAGGTPGELLRLDPDAATEMLVREAQAGNVARVAALAPTVAVAWPTEPLPPLALALRSPDSDRLLAAMLVSHHIAYARAATDDVAGAKAMLVEVRERMAAALPAPAATPAPAAAPPATGKDAEKVGAGLSALATGILERLGEFSDRYARRTEARIAVAEKRPDDALAIMKATELPADAVTAELMTAVKAALPADKAAAVGSFQAVEADAGKARRDGLLAAIPLAMVAPETPRSVVDYDRARPNILGALIGGALSMGTSLLGGISRTDGFRSTPNADGTVMVEFIGNTPSQTLVQEMTLLRAAEVAKAAGKPAFVIVKRKDYMRRLVQTQYGREISSTPTGYKTELTIRAVDKGADPTRALDATGVIDALGPLYYEEKKPA